MYQSDKIKIDALKLEIEALKAKLKLERDIFIRGALAERIEEMSKTLEDLEFRAIDKWYQDME